MRGDAVIRRLVFLITLLVACVSFARDAAAHQTGLSRGRYDLHDAVLDAHVVFANPELARTLVDLDGDRDGALSAAEIERGSGVISRELIARTSVLGDGVACPLTLLGASLTEQDGVDVHFEARCASRPSKVVVHCGFVDALSSSHRHIAVALTNADEATARETVVVRGNMDVVIGGGDGSFRALFFLGIEHILTGYDHLLFLFGLIVMGGRVRSIVAALTAFTVAHSISLALAALGVWAPSPSFVEPAIALSIAYVGAENLWRARKQPTNENPAHDRWRITFPFGLIHGFGFAGALTEIGLSRARIPGALLAFNLGVEVGQLGVLAVVFPLMGWARKFAFVRGRGTEVTNVAIVIAGVVWFVMRVRG